MKSAVRAMLIGGVYIPQCKIEFKDSKNMMIFVDSQSICTQIEIEDINFEKTGENCKSLFMLLTGDIIFLRCRFSGSVNGILCELQQKSNTERDKKFTVIFENCLFEDFKDDAVRIGIYYSA
jgi:hypothetical protein